jgi:hypothetical protein
MPEASVLREGSIQKRKQSKIIIDQKMRGFASFFCVMNKYNANQYNNKCLRFVAAGVKMKKNTFFCTGSFFI